MKTANFTALAIALILTTTLQVCGVEVNIPNNQTNLLQVCLSYGRTRDVSILAQIERLYLNSPNADGFPLGRLKVDSNSVALCQRLAQFGKPGANWKPDAVLKLRFQSPNQELLALHLSLALDMCETQETRQMAVNNLLEAKWPESEEGLNVIFLAHEDRKVRLHLITLAINTKRSSVADNMLRLFEWKHPDATLDLSSKHEIDARRAEHRELKAKLAEAARTGTLDPVELNRATTKWFKDFLAEKHALPPAEAKQRLARFDKLLVLDRMKLAYGILQSNGASDTEIARLVEESVRTEPSAIIRGWLIQACAFALGTTDEAARYLRSQIARDPAPSVQRILQEHLKTVEADLARSRRSK